MKLKQLIESEEAIGNLLKEKLPFDIAMDLREFVLEASNLIKSFNETRNQKIIELGEEVEPNKYSIKDPEKVSEFNTEILLVLDRDIDIKIPTIQREHLKKAELSTQDLITLNWLIK